MHFQAISYVRHIDFFCDVLDEYSNKYYNNYSLFFAWAYFMNKMFDLLDTVGTK